MIVVQRAQLAMFPRYVGGRLLIFLLALDVAIATAYVIGGWKWLAIPDIPLSIFGGVLGVITGFRNAKAYGRWWEARIIWGGVVNASRTFAREVLSMIGPNEGGRAAQQESGDLQRKLILYEIAYVHALRNHLRGTPPWNDLTGLIPEQELERLRTRENVPLAIQQDMASLLARCYRLGWIDTIRWVTLDRTLGVLMDYQGASERIKNTPMPRLYDQFIRFFITIFCLLLPLGMVESLGFVTPVGSTFVGFVFLALDQIGRELERPFENLPNDIPLTAISRTIEINLKQMLGESETPAPLTPVDGVLW